ncbi:hypothetical protein [Hutsoniella sourekii]|uniref:hypothetical protein n=1 Tax=Hutsoniella sourekii TaxID=87650 RepID=UPI00047F701E|nr:hypothetical protein [Hutsoniella sourekii]
MENKELYQNLLLRVNYVEGQCAMIADRFNQLLEQVKPMLTLIEDLEEVKYDLSDIEASLYHFRDETETKIDELEDSISLLEWEN